MSQDLYLELRDKQQILERTLGEMGKRGRENAQAEMEYRIALAEKILAERDKGTPVTIISDVCRGDRKIAKLKLDRDIAETMYDVAKESIQVQKRGITIISEQLDREYKG